MPTKPDRLNYGDTIGIIAPASAPPDPKNIDRSVAVLERLGFKPKLAPNVRKRWGFLAGSDRDRASDLMQDVRRPQGQGHHLRPRRLRHLAAPAAARLPGHPRQPQDLHRLQRHHLAPLRLPGEVQPRLLPRPDAQLGLRQEGPPRLHAAKLPQDADAAFRSGQHLRRLQEEDRHHPAARHRLRPADGRQYHACSAPRSGLPINPHSRTGSSSSRTWTKCLIASTGC